jgi:phosphate transport system permease protein
MVKLIMLIRGDTIAKILLAAAAFFIIGLLIALAVELFVDSSDTITKFGFSFLTGSKWDPEHQIFGALPFVYGTLLTSAIAILIGLPISIGVAIFWGLIVLVPLLQKYIQIPLNNALGFIPLFGGTPVQTSFFTAGVILAIMIIPTVSAVSRDVMNSVPNSQREAMYSLGATDWEVTQKSVLPFARSGLFAAFVLGLGRAVGETMAVTMVIGNTPNITTNLFSPGYTLASLIANQLGEAQGLFRSAIIEIALLLFFIALIINAFARLLLWRTTRGTKVKA